MRKLLNLLLTVLLITASARAHERTVGDLTIVHPWARPAASAQQNSAAYMIIRNDGREPERLLAVETDEAKSAGLHTSTITPEGIAQMRPVETVEVPAGGEVRLAPGGLHIMLVELASPLFEGTSFPMKLVFQYAGEVDVEVMVESSRANTQPDRDHRTGHKP
jgi:copper(I)-binding protein